MDAAEAAGKRLHIASLLLVREFVDWTVPLQVLIVLALSYTVRPEYNSLVCDQSRSDMMTTVTYLGFTAAFELLIFMATCVYLHGRFGISPLSLLRGIIVT